MADATPAFDGSVASAEISESSCNRFLDQAASTAAQHMRCKPFKLSPEHHAPVFLVPYEFDLK